MHACIWTVPRFLRFRIQKRMCFWHWWVNEHLRFSIKNTLIDQLSLWSVQSIDNWNSLLDLISKMVTTVLSYELVSRRRSWRRMGASRDISERLTKDVPWNPRSTKFSLEAMHPWTKQSKMSSKLGRRASKDLAPTGICRRISTVSSLKLSCTSDPKATRTTMRTLGLFHLQQQQFPGQHFNKSPSDCLLLLNKRMFRWNKQREKWSSQNVGEVEMASWMTIKLNCWARPSHTGTKQTMGCHGTRLFLL